MMKRKGITLIELMISISISSIVIAIAYSLMNSSSLFINKRVNAIEEQNYSRLLGTYLQRDLQNAFSDEVIAGSNPLYSIKDVQYFKINDRVIGDRKIFDLLRKSQEEETIVAERLLADSGFNIIPLSEGHFQVNVISYDSLNMERDSFFKVTSRLGVKVKNYIKITLDPLYDSTVKLLYPANVNVDNSDNSWSVRLITGTLRDDFSEKSLLLEGLPEGLYITAIKTDNNGVVIKVLGSSKVALNEAVTVKLTVLPSAVKEAGAVSSAPVELKLLPGSNSFVPSNYLIACNEIVLNSWNSFYGDIIIGSSLNEVIMNKNGNFLGNIYINTDLTINDSQSFGSLTFLANLYIKGNVIVNKESYLHGNMFYEGTLTENNSIRVSSGKKQKTVVNIPKVQLPNLKNLQWYMDKGYTIINSSSGEISLQDNDKYYFPYGYSFNKSFPKVSNVTIACGGDLIFNGDFEGSGLIFAPLGRITFNGECNFEGSLISNITTINENSILKFKQFTELPY